MKTIWNTSAGSNSLGLLIILSILIILSLFLLVTLIRVIRLHTKAEKELVKIRAIIEKHNTEVLHTYGCY